MNFNLSIPEPPLARFIESFFYLDISMATLEGNPNFFIPNGCPTFVIHLKNSMTLHDTTSQIILPKMFFIGVVNRYIHLQPLGDLTSLFIIFKPNALYQLFKVNMKELNKTHFVNAFDILGYKAIMLYESLMRTDTPYNQFRLLQSFFETYLQKNTSRTDLIDHIISCIIREKGRCRVTDIAKHFKITERTLHHNFLVHTGISPKEFVRLIRFTNILNYFKNNPMDNWFEIIDTEQLYDQSHLIKEVKYFTGYTPTKLQSLNMDFLRLLNGTASQLS